MTRYPAAVVVMGLLVLCSCQQEPAADAEVTDAGKAAVAKQGVTFRFPEQFGRSFAFTALLIDKSNTYYDQNLIEVPFVLKVIAIEGVKLATPVRIEADFREGIPQGIAIGDTVEWSGYELLRPVGSPYIKGEFHPQINLHYRNILIVLPQSERQKDQTSTVFNLSSLSAGQLTPHRSRSHATHPGPS